MINGILGERYLRPAIPPDLPPLLVSFGKRMVLVYDIGFPGRPNHGGVPAGGRPLLWSSGTTNPKMRCCRSSTPVRLPCLTLLFILVLATAGCVFSEPNAQQEFRDRLRLPTVHP